MSTFIERVSKIQKELKAPKSQYNKFGQYNYRNQEDILEAVKPLLNGLVLTVCDEVVEIGGRIYIKSTSTITDGTEKLANVAFAREPEEMKGMSPSQISGASSSYSRKYSLNGLFLIDDTKDADSDEVTAKSKGVEAKVNPVLAKVQAMGPLAHGQGETTTQGLNATTTVKSTVTTIAAAVSEEPLAKPKPEQVAPVVKKSGFAGIRNQVKEKANTSKGDLY